MTPAAQMRLIRRIKPMLFVLCLGPLAWQLWRLYTGDVIDPVDEFTHAGGEWTIRFLFATLAITPIRHLTGFSAIIGIRRMLGLFTFFYGLIHLSVFIALDHYFDWPAIIEDITERRYVIAGMTALTLMLPLALTSFNGAIRAMGAKRWQLLHRLVYICAIAALLHYFWLVKSDYTEPLIYAAVLIVFFAIRLYFGLRRIRQQRARKQTRRSRDVPAAHA